MGKVPEIRKDKYYIDGIRRSDTRVFAELFEAWYVNLVMFCGTMVRDMETCEDIVQEMFSVLWEKRSVLVIEKSLKAYLLNAARNRCLNVIRHRKVLDGHADDVLNGSVLASCDVDSYILYSDLRQQLLEIVDSLPPKLKETWVMHRDENMKYREIAEALNVSQRTVEVRISKALAILRRSIKPYMIAVLISLSVIMDKIIVK